MYVHCPENGQGRLIFQNRSTREWTGKVKTPQGIVHRIDRTPQYAVERTGNLNALLNGQVTSILHIGMTIENG